MILDLIAEVYETVKAVFPDLNWWEEKVNIGSEQREQ